MAKVSVARRISSTNNFCPRVFGEMPRPRPVRSTPPSTSVGLASFPLMSSIDRPTADAFSLFLGPGDGDLVPPDHDHGVERSFHELEQLVTLPEEGDHRLVAGDQDLHLGGGSRQSSVFGGWTPVPPCWWPVGGPLQKGSSPDDPS